MDVAARNNVRIVGAEDEPTIVLAHGFGCDQNLWRLVVERLAPDFRLVLFDHVGSGARTRHRGRNRSTAVLALGVPCATLPACAQRYR